MNDTARPNNSAHKADWVKYVRGLDPHGNQGDPESLTKDDLIALADDLEAQAPGSRTETAGTADAGETRTATRTGSGDAGTDTGGTASEYDTQVAGPTGQPTRTSTQRSATTSAVTDRAPEDAAQLAGEQTPAASERVMGLPDSPSAAETGTGH